MIVFCWNIWIRICEILGSKLTLLPGLAEDHSWTGGFRFEQHRKRVHLRYGVLDMVYDVLPVSASPHTVGLLPQEQQCLQFFGNGFIGSGCESKDLSYG